MTRGQFALKCQYLLSFLLHVKSKESNYLFRPIILVRKLAMNFLDWNVLLFDFLIHPQMPPIHFLLVFLDTTHRFLRLWNSFEIDYLHFILMKLS